MNRSWMCEVWQQSEAVLNLPRWFWSFLVSSTQGHRCYLSQSAFGRGQTSSLSSCADRNLCLAGLILQLGWVMHFLWAQTRQPFLYFLHVPIESPAGREELKMGRNRPVHIAWQCHPHFGSSSGFYFFLAMIM